MIRVNIKVDIPIDKIGKQVNDALDKTQFALDEQILKDSNYFIPKDTGNLEQSGITHSRIGEGMVGWNTPYARRLYYNPQYNFSKDKNPNARGLWFEEAKARFKDVWQRIAQSEFDKNL